MILWSGAHMAARVDSAQKAGFGTMLAGSGDEIGGGMNIQVRLEQMPGYLIARFIGVGTSDEGTQKFESIAEHCKLTKNDKLLIDSTGFTIIQPKLADKFFLGERLGIFLRHGIKVAFVSRLERRDLLKFATLVAQNRWVNVEAFLDFQSAEEWLLK
jgi:hypothetical protein